MAEPLIQVEGAGISFGGRPALREVSFEVSEGEIFGFLGPSGAGKTTTIKLLTRQLRPQAGSVRLFGQPVERLPVSAFDQIGVLTDTSGLYERLSVEDNLNLFADLKGVPRARALEALERVGLTDEEKKAAKKLSRGMAQRVMLARAVLHKPRLLFLDEPTAALDPATSRAVQDMLRELNQEGTTIFLTTHRMEEADRLCNRVAFLNEGVIAACDSPQALKLRHAPNLLVAVGMDGERVTAEKSAGGLAELSRAFEGKALSTVHSADTKRGAISQPKQWPGLRTQIISSVCSQPGPRTPAG